MGRGRVKIHQSVNQSRNPPHHPPSFLFASFILEAEPTLNLPLFPPKQNPSQTPSSTSEPSEKDPLQKTGNQRFSL